jgi:hypothetical protein
MGSLRLCLVLACALSSAGTLAATKPAAEVFGTRAQLRECLDIDDGLRQRSDAAEASTAALNGRITANAEESARLADMKKTLARDDKAAVASFNQLAVAHNQHVQQVDDEIAAAQATSDRLAADKADREKKCGGLTYRPADLAAVDKERRKAASAP